MNEYNYQKSELMRYSRERHRAPFFNTVKEFDDTYRGNVKFLTEQIKWIEQGTYGEGACLALQRTWLYVQNNNRVNKRAHIGQHLLRALWGCRFPYWNKLSHELQSELNQAVGIWMKDKKEWALILDKRLEREENHERKL